MASKNVKPLGYIKLPSKDMAIFPMNDVFLNFTFENMEHWEALRMAVNLLIDAFKQLMPNARLYLIEGDIEVRTQFKQFLANEDEDVTTRDQDIRMLELDISTTYVEFQNKANPTVPIKENTPVGELASFLLGINPDPQNEVVKKIADAFNASFKDFKESKDVVKVLTLRERVRDEVWGEAVAEGEAKGAAERDAQFANKFAELKEKALDPVEIMKEMELMFSSVQIAKPSQK